MSAMSNSGLKCDFSSMKTEKHDDILKADQNNPILVKLEKGEGTLQIEKIGGPLKKEPYLEEPSVNIDISIVKTEVTDDANGIVSSGIGETSTNDKVVSGSDDGNSDNQKDQLYNSSLLQDNINRGNTELTDQHATNTDNVNAPDEDIVSTVDEKLINTSDNLDVKMDSFENTETDIAIDNNENSDDVDMSDLSATCEGKQSSTTVESSIKENPVNKIDDDQRIGDNEMNGVKGIEKVQDEIEFNSSSKEVNTIEGENGEMIEPEDISVVMNSTDDSEIKKLDAETIKGTTGNNTSELIVTKTSDVGTAAGNSGTISTESVDRLKAMFPELEVVHRGVDSGNDHSSSSSGFMDRTAKPFQCMDKSFAQLIAQSYQNPIKWPKVCL